MSVPFSNTNLRVPRGFGAILEGLAREVLRDQPDDIPAYAAQYFDKLLKQREESELDPAEWAARLEDGSYNNHAFKNTESVSPENDTAAEESPSKEKTFEEQTESVSNPSATVPSKHPHGSDKIDLTEGTDDEERNDPKENLPILLESQQREKTSGGDKQSEEESGTDEDKEFTEDETNEVDRPDNEVDINLAPDCTTPELDSDLSNLLPVKEISNVDMSSQEVEASEYEEEDQQAGAFEDEETVCSEEEELSDVAETHESLQYVAVTDVDACASEVGGTKTKLEDGISQEDTYSAEEKEPVKPQLEENAVELPPSQYEIPQDNQENAEDYAKTQNERETTETEASHEDINESLAHSEDSLDKNALPKEDSLVEISFDGVPEDPCTSKVLEINPEKDVSMEDTLTYVSEMPQTNKFKELATSSTDIVGIEDQHKSDMEIIKTEVISEEELSHHTAFDILKDKEKTDDFNNSDDDDDEGKAGCKTTELANEMKNHERNGKNDHIEEILDDKPDLNRETNKDMQSNEQDAKEDETADKVCTQGFNELGDQETNSSMVIQNPSLLIKSDISVIVKESEEDGLEQNQQSPRVIGGSQSEDIEEEKQDTFKEEEIANCEVQEESEELGKEEAVTPTDSADWTAADHKEEEGPAAFEDDTASANQSDKEECSRPQEEEDIMDIPLDDPEANRAAAKIQAGFRGHMTRKKMKPEDKTEGEEVSSTGDVLNSSQGGSETGRSGAVERDDTSVPEQ